MLIDAIVITLFIWAIIKGFSQGFVVAIFSTIAIFIGLIAAVKLSAVTANYLHEKANLTMQWLPILSFALVMFVTVILVRVLAKIIQRTMELAALGWLNKIAGIVLYLLLFATVFSVVLFYAKEIKFVSEDTILSSKTYKFIQPLAPFAINGIGKIIPVFKDTFHQLEIFFDAVATRAS